MRIDPDEEDPELYQYEDFEKEEKEDGSFASHKTSSTQESPGAIH